MLEVSEAVVQRSSRSEVFCTKGALKILQNSQENHCARVSFFNKVADLTAATLLKKRLWHSCFPTDFAKFLRSPFFYRTPTVAASEVYFSSHQRNIVCEYKLNGKPTMK